jgi:AraC-like DNA-binding protein
VFALVKNILTTKKRTMVELKSFNVIKTWTLFMTGITLMLVIFSNYFLFYEAEMALSLTNFYRYSSLLWLIAMIYIFKNPVIIFGEVSLLKNIQYNKEQDFQIWNSKPLMLIAEKDKILHAQLIASLNATILGIQNLQISPEIVGSLTLTTETIAKELNVPKSHIAHLFKYYCHYSVNDFSNLVKINQAVQLIQNGFLENYTIAHLGEICLFNSRFTFSKNFKKFMGVSVSDYHFNSKK